MILINLWADDMPKVFLLERQRTDEICEHLQTQTKEWQESEKDSTTADLYARFMTIANTPNEQLYVTYQFGLFVGSNYLPNLGKALLNELNK